MDRGYQKYEEDMIMKNTFHKIFPVALTGAMAVSALTGCGSQSPSKKSSTQASTPAQTNETQSTEAPTETSTDKITDVAGIEGWTAFDDNVVLKIPVYDRGVEGVPTVNDNYWTKWVQEKFGNKYNITVEYVPITRTDVMTDYALLAAAEDLPTILMEYDYPKVAKWADDGYLTTFNMEDFAQVAPTYYNRMVESGNVTYSVINDETYFALAERPNFGGFASFARMDWLEQVGYDHVPRTRAEYVDAMTKIQEAGLSKNPQGGSMITGLGSDQNYGYREYPLNEEEWAMYSSITIPSLGWEADYKLLKRANEDYHLGFTNPEYYITDAETNKASFINGETYQFGSYMSQNVDWLNSFYEKNPDAKLAFIPAGVVDEEGGTVPAWRADNPFGMIVGFSSFATEDELKAAWMYMEWLTQEAVLFEMQWGVEGENYNLNKETGLPEAVTDYSGDYKQGYNNNKDYWCITIESRNAGTAEDIIAANAPKGLPQDFTQDMIDNYYANKELEAQGYACYDPIFSVVLEAESEYSGSLVELYKEYRDELTMCAPEEFDALYEKLSKQYLEAGYQQVIDSRLEAYQNGQSTKLNSHTN